MKEQDRHWQSTEKRGKNKQLRERGRAFEFKFEFERKRVYEKSRLKDRLDPMSCWEKERTFTEVGGWGGE